MAGTWFSALHLHVVFLTAYRHGVLDAAMLRSSQNAMRKVCSDLGAEPRESNGDDDHVHLLAGYPPKVAVPALVNNLKGVPAQRLRSEATGPD
jgi:putative transposase